MKVDIGRLTQEESLELFKELLPFLEEAQVLQVMREWVKEHGLEGELD